MKLIMGWKDRVAEDVADADIHFAIDWMEQRIAEASQQLASLFKDFRLSEALKTIYSLIWDDFCSWYLEWVKPAQGAQMSNHVYERTVDLYEQLIQLLHPYMPFITEEIYHTLRDRKEMDDLIVKQLPVYDSLNEEVLKSGAKLKQLITSIRDARNKNQLKPKDTIQVWVDTAHHSFYELVQSILRRQVNAENIGHTTDAKQGAISIVVGTDKLYIEADAAIDVSVQKDKLQKELDYLKGFLISVDKKLSNERFVQNAKPEIVEVERSKKSDAEAKIKAIEESLSLL